MNILIAPCSTEIGSEIYRSLRYTKGIKLFGINSLPGIHETRHFKSICSSAPYIESSSFINYIKQKVNEWSIDFIFPAHDDAALILKKHEEEIGCPIITSSLATNEICRDKSKTYSFFSEYEFCPRTYNTYNVKESDLPLFVKPKVGQGSKGAKKILSMADLHSCTDKDVLCEMLIGEELTIDCFTDKDRNLVYIGPRIRERVQNGISVSSTSVPLESEVSKIAEIINSNLELIGAWFFQIKRDTNNQFKLLEIATRIAGSMSTNRMKGVNFAELSLWTHRGIPIKIDSNSLTVRIERALENRYISDASFDEVYTDFDDCLLIEGAVNTKLLAFLYQCKNKGLKITLITRHTGEIRTTLAKHSLSEVADQIIHITDTHIKKSKFITNSKALFIDDSFRERNDVYLTSGALAVAPDQIELFNP